MEISKGGYYPGSSKGPSESLIFMHGLSRGHSPAVLFCGGLTYSLVLHHLYVSWAELGLGLPWFPSAVLGL